jgi:CXXX repeat modification system protein
MAANNRFIIGKVTENEKMEVEKIYKRKLALESLARLWGSNRNESYDGEPNIVRLIDELGEVQFAMRMWWTDVAKKYGWTYERDYVWEIDFSTNEITIEKRTSI